MPALTASEYGEMQQYFLSGATTSYRFRKEKLEVLRNGIRQYEPQILEALYKDLHKSQEEAFTTEVGFLYAEISHTLAHLGKWMRTTAVSTPAFLLPSSSSITRVPHGVCLIIAPWNYPFQLLIAPLIGAIAGGNCCVLKPSEIAAHTSKVIGEMVAEIFEQRYVVVVEGEGSIVVPQLMHENRFDHVFFTGSIPVGRQIARMAAKKLVPVTLELGGKSPCIVDTDADIKVAARRIVWGKFTNAGQTCVAPDYLLVAAQNKDQLVAEMIKSIEMFYGKNPLQSEEYGRIINEKRLETLVSYLEQGTTITGGTVDAKQRYFAPTIMQDILPGAAVMKEEIFGPILPVITFKEREEALAVINENSNPLSLYYFGNNQENENFFVQNVQYGGGCVNNTLVHLGNPDLPFGGVGNSGVGAYHGKFSFDTFTRGKAILKSATWFDPAVKYPPYKGKMKFLRWLFK